MLRNVPGGDDENHPYRSTLRLKENGVPLLFAHQNLDDVVQLGAGRHSHWHDDLVFSASDNSDPNANGRFYSFDFHLDPETWERARAGRLAKLWKFHPGADYFLTRGGTEIAPPVACNISLTSATCAAKSAEARRTWTSLASGDVTWTTGRSRPWRKRYFRSC
jgi:hypothetical protein